MILVTVGNTAFDSLVKEADKLKGDMIIQKADGLYIPKNHKYFNYGDLQPYFKKASIVITHGGAGNIFRLLSMNKKIIAIANTDRTDKHQEELLKKLSQKKYLIWCKKITELKSLINKKEVQTNKYIPPRNDIAKNIIRRLK